MQTIAPEKLSSWLSLASQQHREACLRGLRKGAALSHGRVIQRTSTAKPYPAVDTGRYKNSWVWMATDDGAVLFNDSPQAGPLELGVRPGRIPLPDKGNGKLAPFPSLVQWARRKFANKQIRKASGARKGASDAARSRAVARGIQREKDVDDLAFAIAVAVQRKLHFRGMAARRVMTDPTFVAWMGRTVRREIGRELRGVARG